MNRLLDKPRALSDWLAKCHSDTNETQAWYPRLGHCLKHCSATRLASASPLQSSVVTPGPSGYLVIRSRASLFESLAVRQPYCSAALLLE